MLIRRAVPDDAPALVPLYDAWSHPQPAGVIAERIAAWAALDRASILVADAGGALGYEDRCERSARFMRSL